MQANSFENNTCNTQSIETQRRVVFSKSLLSSLITELWGDPGTLTRPWADGQKIRKRVSTALLELADGINSLQISWEACNDIQDLYIGFWICKTQTSSYRDKVILIAWQGSPEVSFWTQCRLLGRRPWIPSAGSESCLLKTEDARTPPPRHTPPFTGDTEKLCLGG